MAERTFLVSVVALPDPPGSRRRLVGPTSHRGVGHLGDHHRVWSVARIYRWSPNHVSRHGCTDGALARFASHLLRPYRHDRWMRARIVHTTSCPPAQSRGADVVHDRWAPRASLGQPWKRRLPAPGAHLAPERSRGQASPRLAIGERDGAPRPLAAPALRADAPRLAARQGPRLSGLSRPPELRPYPVHERHRELSRLETLVTHAEAKRAVRRLLPRAPARVRDDALRAVRALVRAKVPAREVKHPLRAPRALAPVLDADGIVGHGVTRTMVTSTYSSRLQASPWRSQKWTRPSAPVSRCLSTIRNVPSLGHLPSVTSSKAQGSGVATAIPLFQDDAPHAVEPVEPRE